MERSFYHDLITDKIITEHEYNKRTENLITASLVYFGEYRNKKEAQQALDTEYSYLKKNGYYHPQ